MFRTPLHSDNDVSELGPAAVRHRYNAHFQILRLCLFEASPCSVSLLMFRSTGVVPAQLSSETEDRGPDPPQQVSVGRRCLSWAGASRVRPRMHATKGGIFAQRVHSANDDVVHPGNTPANHPPYRSVHDPFITASGVQNSGPWDPWLPVVENSRLFAQRTVRPQSINLLYHRVQPSGYKGTPAPASITHKHLSPGNRYVERCENPRPLHTSLPQEALHPVGHP